VPRIHGKKYRLALGHRVRRHLAYHEGTAAPVDVVLGEVARELNGRPEIRARYLEV